VYHDVLLKKIKISNIDIALQSSWLQNPPKTSSQ
jgi:hypothetical protein